MRKSFKKGMAVLLAAAMVFSTPVAVSKTEVQAAATPEQVPVIDLDFEDGTEEGTTYTEGGFAFDVTGGAKVVANPDDSDDKVIAFTPDSTGEATGNQYITTKTDALKNLDFSKGFSISMAVKPTKQKTDWNYLFSMGSLKVDGNERWLDGTIGFITRYAATYKANFPGDGWVSGNSVDSKYDYFVGGEGINKWSTLTYVYGEDNVSLYVNGLLTNQWKSEASIKTILGQLNAGNLSLGGGIDPALEHYTGYMDDVKVYNSVLNASQVYKLATGKDAVADGLFGDVKAELSADGKSINLNYNTKMSIPVEDLSIKVNDEVVATGSAVKTAASGAAVEEAGVVSGAATYVYTPDKDGEYKFAVAATERTVDGTLYLAQEVTATITVVKDGDRFYVKDDTLFTDFGVSKTTTDKVFKVDWKAADGVTASVKVTDKSGKQVGKTLTAPGNVTVSAEGEYTAEIVAKKDSSIKKDSTKFTYKASAGNPAKTDKFSKVTTKPLYKYTFDDAKEVTLSSKATVKNGVLNLAPTADKHGEYYAKIDSMTADDFSKGITFIADINVKAGAKNADGTFNDWTHIVTFGDGTPAKKDAAGATYRWAFTEGFSSKAGTNADYHAAGYYGNEISAPYTWDYFNTAANCNKWYTIAVTVKKNEMITYINGVQVQKGTSDYSAIINGMKKSSNNYLGVSYWDADYDFAGMMDDVAVYNTALSAADVKKLNRSDVTTGGGTGGGVTGGGSTAKVSKVSIKVPNRKAGKTIYVKKGDKVTLKATVTGSGKYSKSVTWKTSKKSVATVSSKGKVTAKKAGTAKITATSKTDKSKKATITIKVSKKAKKNKTLKISPTKKTLKKGKTLTIKIKKTTKKTTDKITYKSSKKSVATVDAYGKVKAKKKGKATITVKCGKKKAKLKLTVKK